MPPNPLFRKRLISHDRIFIFIRSQFGGRGGGRFAIRTQLGVFGEDGVEIFEEFGGWLGEQVEVGRGYTIRSQFGGRGGYGLWSASRLEFSELVDASVEDAGGGRAGSFDGAAEFFGGLVEVEAGVGVVAAAEPP